MHACLVVLCMTVLHLLLQQISNCCLPTVENFSRSNCYAVWSAIGKILSSVYLSVCDDVYVVLRSICRGWKLCRHVHRRVLPIHCLRHFCCRLHRLARNGEKADSHQKQTSARNRKYLNTHADHGHSRQRSLAVPHAVRRAITATAELLVAISFSIDGTRPLQTAAVQRQYTRGGGVNNLSGEHGPLSWYEVAVYEYRTAVASLA